jgi:hypothetical protein
MQAGEERPVLKRVGHKRIQILLEGQIDADSDGPGASGRPGDAFVRRLHQSGAAARDDVATHRRQRGGRSPGLVVAKRAGLRPRRAEDGHAIPFAV